MNRRLAPLALLGLLLSAPAAADISLDEDRTSALLALPPLDGQALQAEDLTGRVVVIGFFASWCPPCRPEFETLNAIHEACADKGVEVLAVNIFEDHFKQNLEVRRRTFLATTAPQFKLLGEGERIAELFGPVTRIPTTFVFGRDGRPVMHFIHTQGASKTHATLEELRAAVQSAL